MEALYSYSNETGPSTATKLFLLAVVIGVLLITVTTHAVGKHGASALATISCAMNGGVLQTFHNPDTNRDAHLCDVDGKFGIVIQEGDTIVTAFLKDKMKSVDQAIRYLQNAGYKP